MHLLCLSAAIKIRDSSERKKVNTFSPVIVSKELKQLMFVAYNDIRNSPILWCDVFYRSIIQLLFLLLLDASPDFIHVVSLKSSFLYVTSSVRRVLG